MTEAINAVVTYGFHHLRLTKMEAHTLLLNSRAIHLLKRTHFQVDGLVRGNTVVDGKFEDEVFFSVHKRDWPYIE